MTEAPEGKAETMQVIKEVLYDLQIGPTEISRSMKEPLFFSVKFENQTGGNEEVFVPIPSAYDWIYGALKHAYHGTGPS
jgi:hypothetical protein